MEQPAVTTPIDRPRVLLLFDGLLAGNFDARTQTYQVGVLPASGHQFSIVVNEFKFDGDPADDVRIPISRRETKFLNLNPRSRWTFVLAQAGASAVAFDSGTPPDRLNPPDDDDLPEAKDHRWAVSLDDKKDFLNQGDLTPVPGLLNPIISFRNGLFYSQGLIREPTHIFRTREGHDFEELGVIAASFRANLDIAVGQRVILSNESGEEIFNLRLKENGSYSILFHNTPAHEHSPLPGERGHFPLFYTAFLPSGDRYDLTTLRDGLFPDFELSDQAMEMGGFGAPAPFRCGLFRVDTALI